MTMLSRRTALVVGPRTFPVVGVVITITVRPTMIAVGASTGIEFVAHLDSVYSERKLGGRDCIQTSLGDMNTSSLK